MNILEALLYMLPVRSGVVYIVDKGVNSWRWGSNIVSGRKNDKQKSQAENRMES